MKLETWQLESFDRARYSREAKSPVLLANSRYTEQCFGKILKSAIPQLHFFMQLIRQHAVVLVSPVAVNVLFKTFAVVLSRDQLKALDFRYTRKSGVTVRSESVPQNIYG